MPSPTRHNLHRSLLEGFAATPWSILSAPGGFLIAALLNDFFEIGPFWFGLVAAMPALANGLHILFLRPISRRFRVRALTLSQGWLNLALWVVGFVGIALMPAEAGATAGYFFVVLFALVSISSALGNVGWTAWIGDFVPQAIRGRFIARRNLFTNIAMLAFMGLGLFVLERLDASRTAYLLLIGIALVGRLVSMIAQHGIASPDPTGGVGVEANWREEILRIWRDRPLFRLIAFGAAANFWMAFLGTIHPLYALGNLGASPADFTGFVIAATLSGTICVQYWGRLVDRRGAIPVIVISFIAWRIGDLGWLFLTPETVSWLYLISVWGGAMGAGYSLACFTLLLKLLAKEHTMAGISINQVASSATSFLAPVLAGSLLLKGGALAEDTATVYRLAIAVGLAGSFLSIFILIRFRKGAGSV